MTQLPERLGLCEGPQALQMRTPSLSQHEWSITKWLNQHYKLRVDLGRIVQVSLYQGLQSLRAEGQSERDLRGQLHFSGHTRMESGRTEQVSIEQGAQDFLAAREGAEDL